MTPRATDNIDQAAPQAMGAHLAAISRWVDDHPTNARRDREAAVWGRVAKVGEEVGEAAEAWLAALAVGNGKLIAAMIAATGQNPRKGQSGCMDDVVKELLDVAVTALAAVEHLSGNDGGSVDMLTEHVAGLIVRAGL